MYLQGVMDKIIVKVLVTKEKVTDGGIVLTEDVAKKQEPQVAGVVMSFGDEISYDLKIGDILLFHNRAGMDIVLDKEIFKVIKSDEIYGVLRDDDEQGNLKERIMELDEFKIVVEGVLQNYVWEKLNEDTETNIINDIFKLIEGKSPLDFKIEFNNDEKNVLKINITFSGKILEYEIKCKNEQCVDECTCDRLESEKKQLDEGSTGNCEG